jgi:sulfate permease, SulP family
MTDMATTMVDGRRGLSGGQGLRADLVAGLTVALMGVPQAMAYALIALAGLPQETAVRMGLYAAIVPPVVAGLFGSSRFLVTGPTNATALLVFSLIHPYIRDGHPVATVLGIMLAFSVSSGVILLLGGLLKLGQIVRYVAQSALTGFLAAAGILIILGQLRNSLGIAQEQLHPLPWAAQAEYLPDTVRTLIRTLASLGETNGRALAVTAVSLVLLWAVRRIHPKLPTVLVTLVVVTGAVVLLGWHEGSVALVRTNPLDPAHPREIPASLPPLSMPLFTFSLWRDYLSGGAALALLGILEAITAAKALAARTGDRLNVNHELVGQGLARIAAGFTSGLVPSGSQTRSALNMISGAQSRVAQIASGVFTLFIVMLLARPAGYIPIPVLSAVVLYSAVGLIDVAQIRRLIAGTRSDAVVLVITIFSTIVLRLDHAIYVGAFLSVLAALQRTSRLVVSEMVFGTDGHWHECKPDAQTGTSAVVLLQVEGALYFGAADELVTYLRQVAANRPRVVILRLKRAHHLDATIAESLRNLARDWRTGGTDLLLCGLRPETVGLVERMGLAEAIGVDHLFLTDRSIFGSVSRAVARARQIAGQIIDRPMLREEMGAAVEDYSI